MEILYKMKEDLMKTFLGTTCLVAGEVMPVPKIAFSQQRKQYYSTVLLREIYNYSENWVWDRVLGVTEVDLYVPQLNFVFGEAALNGRVALISLYRLRPEFYGEHSNKPVFYERSLKEAIHEIGHTLGLKHCDDENCVMFFSNSIIDTDRKKASFCKKCEVLVRRRVGRN